jgi:hypothetical protein
MTPECETQGAMENWLRESVINKGERLVWAQRSVLQRQTLNGELAKLKRHLPYVLHITILLSLFQSKRCVSVVFTSQGVHKF